ncbi:hypothetical protein Vretimale_19666 [Volvox reticuliferus]|uniref:G domain-containing protein n=1 Tax=Volvox reticuliferus TaxID=1737510 RepID=A0A8J4D6Z4_9CHLO|nr:hypothetical protein Vretifemale_20685 [Volvox reticuliferus]GIM17137.1 hypothetical protein Vretimale_19666 [Volvox reticuliferus]
MAGGRYSWFPGHMAKALKQMEQQLKMIDILVEVRDARLPLSSANPLLDRLAGRKRRLVVLNKIDLADHTATKAACALLQSQGHRVVPCVARRDGGAGKVLDAALGWLQSERCNTDLNLMMVAGAPNTGKSSLINALKRAAQREGLLDGEHAFQRTARSGPLPGVTRQLGGFKVCHSPLLYVLDTPGVLPPALPDEDVAVRLALAGLMPADSAGLSDDVLVRHLVQILVSEPRHQRQLWMAADGQVAAALARQRAADMATTARDRFDGGDAVGVGASVAGSGWRPREKSSVALARALHDIVTMPALPPLDWHPGMDDGVNPYGGVNIEDTDDAYPLEEPVANSSGGVGKGGGSGSKACGRADTERRVAALVRQLTRGSVVDIGRRNSLLRGVIQSFREGALGRYTLDEVGVGDGVAGTGGKIPL